MNEPGFALSILLCGCYKVRQYEHKWVLTWMMLVWG